MEGVPQNQFRSPEEEINFLRQQLAEKERGVLDRAPDIDQVERHTIAKEQLKEYTSFTPQVVLDKNYVLDEQEVAAKAVGVEMAVDPVEDILHLASEKGIKNALSVLEKTDNSFVVDEVHRRLIEQLHQGVGLADLKEGVPPWNLLHMTLYEVSLPARRDEHKQELDIPAMVGVMQQLFAGLRIIGSAKHANHFAIEVAVANGDDSVIFYVAVPDEFKSLFEKQMYSLYPEAVLTELVNDYNVFTDAGITKISHVSLQKFYGYPLKPVAEFSSDPIAVLLNAFSQMQKEGEGAAIQFVMRHPTQKYRKRVESVIKKVEKGDSASAAISATTVTGEIAGFVSGFFAEKKKDEPMEHKVIDQEAIELFRSKITSELIETNIRLVVSAASEERAAQLMQELEAILDQFDTPNANTLKASAAQGRALRLAQKAFSFRQFVPDRAITLSVAELATLVHFPANGLDSTPELKQSQAATAPAPLGMPTEGTLLGINKHRGVETPIYVTEKDRMRHFYVIGQTGVGKSGFLQNLVRQDIESGAGVCMIDPHGTDVEEIMGALPPERQDDVIYFDPSRLDRSIGLNMLEYDQTKPEQKTFVVNELLSIFQKLYGANPESMGPMFEQYFRNATMLVMEDPESGNTLMDISRVMADAKYRRYKLSRATNPVVVQFWQEIAGKAGGESSLENVVPYIVSKIDPLTANDYIRPIIGQQHSSFNFRQIMDQRKILLVNLSKGRLGEINANLIGMVIVGKILMAALSRVDDPSKSFPPFYLHIDEFQNVSTPAIASILSEARKYKLSLTMAHQFIAQLDPEIRDAVFGNVGSMALLRVGNEDAEALVNQVDPVFSVNDLMNTPNYNAVFKVLANGVPMQPFSAALVPPPEFDLERAAAIRELSYSKYGRLRDEVETEIQQRYQAPAKPAPPQMPMT